MSCDVLIASELKPTISMRAANCSDLFDLPRIVVPVSELE